MEDGGWRMEDGGWRQSHPRQASLLGLHCLITTDWFDLWNSWSDMFQIDPAHLLHLDVVMSWVHPPAHLLLLDVNLLLYRRQHPADQLWCQLVVLQTGLLLLHTGLLLLQTGLESWCPEVCTADWVSRLLSVQSWQDGGSACIGNPIGSIIWNSQRGERHETQILKVNYTGEHYSNC